MDRFSILKNPDLKPHHAYALTPEERRIKEEEKRFREQRARRSTADIERESIVSQYVRTPNGRAQLAASMMNPLRQRMDFGSLARRMFRVDPLPDGALPVYPRVGNNPAYVYGEEGQAIETIVRGGRIFAPLFEIGSNPEIPLTRIQERRYNLIERAQDLAYQDIRRAEESRAFDLLRHASNGNTNITATQFNSQNSVTDTLRQAFDNLEGPARELRVANIFLSAQDYASIRRHISREHLDVETRNELRRAGLFANLWGAQMLVTRGIPPGEIFLTSEPQHVGVLPIRTDITVLAADNPEQMRMGWSIFENIGMGCLNPQGVVRITIPNSLVRTTQAIRNIGFGDDIEIVPGNIMDTPENSVLLDEIFRE